MSETSIIEIVTIPEKKGKKIQCKCGNIWTYCGKNQNYCSCSRCRTTITINKKNKKNPLRADVRVGGSTQHAMVIENHPSGVGSYEYD
jgi:hypothetical protein